MTPARIDVDLARALRTLLHEQRVAALGTLHGKEPYVSMVPFARVSSPIGFVIHVSRLAAHTKDMLESASVSLLVMATPGATGSAQALARVTIQGDARPLLAGGARHHEAKQAYLERFPDSEPMFGFSDFSLFEIVPRSLRFVGGFAQAKTLTPDGLAEILQSD
jgi:heme oxygenase (biliverdin-IX-beta and delta-forming)